MPDLLYKVSPPRDDRRFYPSTFWHSADWESSTDRPRAGYIEDTVLYAGDFDEINIHLFPRVRTVRVRAVDATPTQLRDVGLNCQPGKTAYIFAPAARRAEVESFSPTIFTFDARPFTRVRKGEYVAREPQTALSSETIALRDALIRWNIEACFVDDLDAVVRVLSGAKIYFDEQT